jgi:hypothetical protein
MMMKKTLTASIAIILTPLFGADVARMTLKLSGYTADTAMT